MIASSATNKQKFLSNKHMARRVNLGQWWLHRDLMVEGTGFNKLQPHERPITLFSLSLSLSTHAPDYKAAFVFVVMLLASYLVFVSPNRASRLSFLNGKH
jgi:hypothetical protein